jgi:hypothetical protein
MIQDTLTQIERKLSEVNTVTPETRRELAQLLATLNQEIAALSTTTSPPAETITTSSGSPEPAAIDADEPEMLEATVEKLRESVEGFENSHPRLVEAINRIATTLAGLGI